MTERMHSGSEVLVVMAKYPQPGSVKTRLAQVIGDEPACALYRAFLLDLAERFRSAERALLWAVHPPGTDLSAVIGPCASLPQEGCDLGERMWHAFRSVFSQGAERVVMIGADAPHLSEAEIDAAFRLLDTADVNLVPTRDGGYCLVGLRAPHDIFTSVEMGTDTVLRQTLERCRILGLHVHQLPESFDIDEPEDLDDLSRLIEARAVLLPHTAAILRSLERRGC